MTPPHIPLRMTVESFNNIEGCLETDVFYVLHEYPGTGVPQVPFCALDALPDGSGYQVRMLDLSTVEYIGDEHRYNLPRDPRLQVFADDDEPIDDVKDENCPTDDVPPSRPLRAVAAQPGPAPAAQTSPEPQPGPSGVPPSRSTRAPAAQPGPAPPAQPGPAPAARASPEPQPQSGPSRVPPSRPTHAPAAQPGRVPAAQTGPAPPAQTGPVPPAQTGPAAPAQPGPVPPARISPEPSRAAEVHAEPVPVIVSTSSISEEAFYSVINQNLEATKTHSRPCPESPVVDFGSSAPSTSKAATISYTDERKLQQKTNHSVQRQSKELTGLTPPPASRENSSNHSTSQNRHQVSNASSLLDGRDGPIGQPVLPQTRQVVPGPPPPVRDDSGSKCLKAVVSQAPNASPKQATMDSTKEMRVAGATTTLERNSVSSIFDPEQPPAPLRSKDNEIPLVPSTVRSSQTSVRGEDKPTMDKSVKLISSDPDTRKIDRPTKPPSPKTASCSFGPSLDKCAVLYSKSVVPPSQSSQPPAKTPSSLSGSPSLGKPAFVHSKSTVPPQSIHPPSKTPSSVVSGNPCVDKSAKGLSSSACVDKSVKDLPTLSGTPTPTPIEHSKSSVSPSQFSQPPIKTASSSSGTPNLDKCAVLYTSSVPPAKTPSSFPGAPRVDKPAFVHSTVPPSQSNQPPSSTPTSVISGNECVDKPAKGLSSSACVDKSVKDLPTLSGTPTPTPIEHSKSSVSPSQFSQPPIKTASSSSGTPNLDKCAVLYTSSVPPAKTPSSFPGAPRVDKPAFVHSTVPPSQSNQPPSSTPTSVVSGNECVDKPAKGLSSSACVDKSVKGLLTSSGTPTPTAQKKGVSTAEQSLKRVSSFDPKAPKLGKSPEVEISSVPRRLSTSYRDWEELVRLEESAGASNAIKELIDNPQPKSKARLSRVPLNSASRASSAVSKGSPSNTPSSSASKSAESSKRESHEPSGTTTREPHSASKKYEKPIRPLSDDTSSSKAKIGDKSYEKKSTLEITSKPKSPQCSSMESSGTQLPKSILKKRAPEVPENAHATSKESLTQVDTHVDWKYNKISMLIGPPATKRRKTVDNTSEPDPSVSRENVSSTSKDETPMTSPPIPTVVASHLGQVVPAKADVDQDATAPPSSVRENPSNVDIPPSADKAADTHQKSAYAYEPSGPSADQPKAASDRGSGHPCSRGADHLEPSDDTSPSPGSCDDHYCMLGDECPLLLLRRAAPTQEVPTSAPREEPKEREEAEDEVDGCLEDFAENLLEKALESLVTPPSSVGPAESPSSLNDSKKLERKRKALSLLKDSSPVVSPGIHKMPSVIVSSGPQLQSSTKQSSVSKDSGRQFAVSTSGVGSPLCQGDASKYIQKPQDGVLSKTDDRERLDKTKSVSGESGVLRQKPELLLIPYKQFLNIGKVQGLQEMATEPHKTASKLQVTDKKSSKPDISQDRQESTVKIEKSASKSRFQDEKSPKPDTIEGLEGLAKESHKTASELQVLDKKSSNTGKSQESQAPSSKFGAATPEPLVQSEKTPKADIIQELIIHRDRLSTVIRMCGLKSQVLDEPKSKTEEIQGREGMATQLNKPVSVSQDLTRKSPETAKIQRHEGLATGNLKTTSDSLSLDKKCLKTDKNREPQASAAEIKKVSSESQVQGIKSSKTDQIEELQGMTTTKLLQPAPESQKHENSRMADGIKGRQESAPDLRRTQKKITSDSQVHVENSRKADEGLGSQDRSAGVLKGSQKSAVGQADKSLNPDLLKKREEVIPKSPGMLMTPSHESPKEDAQKNQKSEKSGIPSTSIKMNISQSSVYQLTLPLSLKRQKKRSLSSSTSSSSSPISDKESVGDKLVNSTGEHQGDQPSSLKPTNVSHLRSEQAYNKKVEVLQEVLRTKGASKKAPVLLRPNIDINKETIEAMNAMKKIQNVVLKLASSEEPVQVQSAVPAVPRSKETSEDPQKPPGGVLPKHDVRMHTAISVSEDSGIQSKKPESQVQDYQSPKTDETPRLHGSSAKPHKTASKSQVLGETDKNQERQESAARIVKATSKSLVRDENTPKAGKIQEPQGSTADNEKSILKLQLQDEKSVRTDKNQELQQLKDAKIDKATSKLLIQDEKTSKVGSVQEHQRSTADCGGSALKSRVEDEKLAKTDKNQERHESATKMGTATSELLVPDEKTPKAGKVQERQGPAADIEKSALKSQVQDEKSAKTGKNQERQESAAEIVKATSKSLVQDEKTPKAGQIQELQGSTTDTKKSALKLQVIDEKSVKTAKHQERQESAAVIDKFTSKSLVQGEKTPKAGKVQEHQGSTADIEQSSLKTQVHNGKSTNNDKNEKCQLSVAKIDEATSKCLVQDEKTPEADKIEERQGPTADIEHALKLQVQDEKTPKASKVQERQGSAADIKKSALKPQLRDEKSLKSGKNQEHQESAAEIDKATSKSLVQGEKTPKVGKVQERQGSALHIEKAALKPQLKDEKSGKNQEHQESAAEIDKATSKLLVQGEKTPKAGKIQELQRSTADIKKPALKLQIQDDKSTKTDKNKEREETATKMDKATSKALVQVEKTPKAGGIQEPLGSTAGVGKPDLKLQVKDGKSAQTDKTQERQEPTTKMDTASAKSLVEVERTSKAGKIQEPLGSIEKSALKWEVQSKKSLTDENQERQEGASKIGKATSESLVKVQKTPEAGEFQGLEELLTEFAKHLASSAKPPPDYLKAVEIKKEYEPIGRRISEDERSVCSQDTVTNLILSDYSQPTTPMTQDILSQPLSVASVVTDEADKDEDEISKLLAESDSQSVHSIAESTNGESDAISIFADDDILLADDDSRRDGSSSTQDVQTVELSSQEDAAILGSSTKQGGQSVELSSQEDASILSSSSTQDGQSVELSSQEDAAILGSSTKQGGQSVELSSQEDASILSSSTEQDVQSVELSSQEDGSILSSSSKQDGQSVELSSQEDDAILVCSQSPVHLSSQDSDCVIVPLNRDPDCTVIPLSSLGRQKPPNVIDLVADEAVGASDRGVVTNSRGVRKATRARADTLPSISALAKSRVVRGNPLAQLRKLIASHLWSACGPWMHEKYMSNHKVLRRRAFFQKHVDTLSAGGSSNTSDANPTTDDSCGVSQPCSVANISSATRGAGATNDSRVTDPPLSQQTVGPKSSESVGPSSDNLSETSSAGTINDSSVTEPTLGDEAGSPKPVESNCPTNDPIVTERPHSVTHDHNYVISDDESLSRTPEPVPDNVAGPRPTEPVSPSNDPISGTSSADATNDNRVTLADTAASPKRSECNSPSNYPVITDSPLSVNHDHNYVIVDLCDDESVSRTPETIPFLTDGTPVTAGILKHTPFDWTGVQERAPRNAESVPFLDDEEYPPRTDQARKRTFSSRRSSVKLLNPSTTSSASAAAPALQKNDAAPPKKRQKIVINLDDEDEPASSTSQQPERRHIRERLGCNVSCNSGERQVFVLPRFVSRGIKRYHGIPKFSAATGTWVHQAETEDPLIAVGKRHLFAPKKRKRPYKDLTQASSSDDTSSSPEQRSTTSDEDSPSQARRSEYTRFERETDPKTSGCSRNSRGSSSGSERSELARRFSGVSPLATVNPGSEIEGSRYRSQACERRARQYSPSEKGGIIGVTETGFCGGEPIKITWKGASGEATEDISREETQKKVAREVSGEEAGREDTKALIEKAPTDNVIGQAGETRGKVVRQEVLQDDSVGGGGREGTRKIIREKTTPEDARKNDRGATEELLGDFPGDQKVKNGVLGDFPGIHSPRNTNINKGLSGDYPGDNSAWNKRVKKGLLGDFPGDKTALIVPKEKPGRGEGEITGKNVTGEVTGTVPREFPKFYGPSDGLEVVGECRSKDVTRKNIVGEVTRTVPGEFPKFSGPNDGLELVGEYRGSFLEETQKGFLGSVKDERRHCAGQGQRKIDARAKETAVFAAAPRSSSGRLSSDGATSEPTAELQDKLQTVFLQFLHSSGSMGTGATRREDQHPGNFSPGYTEDPNNRVLEISSITPHSTISTIGKPTAVFTEDATGGTAGVPSPSNAVGTTATSPGDLRKLKLANLSDNGATAAPSLECWGKLRTDASGYVPSKSFSPGFGISQPSCGVSNSTSPVPHIIDSGGSQGGCLPRANPPSLSTQETAQGFPGEAIASDTSSRGNVSRSKPPGGDPTSEGRELQRFDERENRLIDKKYQTVSSQSTYWQYKRGSSDRTSDLSSSKSGFSSTRHGKAQKCPDQSRSTGVTLAESTQERTSILGSLPEDIHTEPHPKRTRFKEFQSSCSESNSGFGQSNLNAAEPDHKKTESGIKISDSTSKQANLNIETIKSGSKQTEPGPKLFQLIQGQSGIDQAQPCIDQAKHGSVLNEAIHSQFKQTEFGMEQCTSGVDKTECGVRRNNCCSKQTEFGVKQAESSAQKGESLDNSQARSQLEKYKPEADQQSKSSDKQAETSVRKGESLDNSQARSQLEKYKPEDDQQSKSSDKQAETSVGKGESLDNSQARSQLEKYKPKADQQSKSSVKQTQSGVEQAESAVEQAQSGVEQAQPGVEQAQSGVEQAQPGVEQARSGVKQAQSGVEQAVSGVAQAQFLIKETKSRIEQVKSYSSQTKSALEQAKSGSKKVKSNFKHVNCHIRENKRQEGASRPPFYQREELQQAYPFLMGSNRNRIRPSPRDEIQFRIGIRAYESPSKESSRFEGSRSPRDDYSRNIFYPCDRRYRSPERYHPQPPPWRQPQPQPQPQPQTQINPWAYRGEEAGPSFRGPAYPEWPHSSDVRRDRRYY